MFWRLRRKESLGEPLERLTEGCSGSIVGVAQLIFLAGSIHVLRGWDSGRRVPGDGGPQRIEFHQGHKAGRVTVLGSFELIRNTLDAPY